MTKSSTKWWPIASVERIATRVSCLTAIRGPNRRRCSSTASYPSKLFPTPTVIHLEVRIETLVRRISTRRQCPACSRIYNVLSQAPKTRGICDEDGAGLIIRHDDTEEVIHQRLKAYEEITGPVITHYRGARYHRVNGDHSPEEVHREIVRLLASGPRWARRPRGKAVLDGRRTQTNWA